MRSICSPKRAQGGVVFVDVSASQTLEVGPGKLKGEQVSVSIFEVMTSFYLLSENFEVFYCWARDV